MVTHCNNEDELPFINWPIYIVTNDVACIVTTIHDCDTKGSGYWSISNSYSSSAPRLGRCVVRNVTIYSKEEDNPRTKHGADNLSNPQELNIELIKEEDIE